VTLANAQIHQFRGPERDGKFPESNLLKAWPEEGPELLLEFEGIGEVAGGLWKIMGPVLSQYKKHSYH